MTRRRRIFWAVLGGLAVVLVLGAAFAWYVVLPDWRPPLQDGERYGVDVSAHQGEIRWADVADDDIAFAYIKASEGKDLTDEAFADNWKGAKEAGLDRGAYHFFTLCSSGKEQALQFLSVAPPAPDSLPPAVDLELAGNCADRPDQAVVADNLTGFIDTVERAWGRKLVLYVGDDWESAYPTRDAADRPLWLRRFMRRPSGTDWDIWQVHGLARVKGIDGRVDLDVMRPQ